MGINMPLVEIWKDERYPDYGMTVLREKPPYESKWVIHLTDDEIKAVQEAEKQYSLMQEFLAGKMGE
jgi:hypothetical protein